MIIEDLDALIDRYERELLPLSDEALDRVPENGGWSARQTIGHLLLTVRQYCDKLEGLIRRKPRGRKPREKAVKPGFFGGYLLKVLPNPLKRFKTPGKFDPRRSDERFTVEHLVAQHRRLRALAERIDELNLGHCKFGTPISPLLRLRARSAIEVQVEHGRRHLAQALRAAGVAEAA